MGERARRVARLRNRSRLAIVYNKIPEGKEPQAPAAVPADAQESPCLPEAFGAHQEADHGTDQGKPVPHTRATSDQPHDRFLAHQLPMREKVPDGGDQPALGAHAERDLETGAVVFERDGAVPLVPGSVSKIADRCRR